MMKLIAFSSCIILLFSCAANKKLQSVNEMPACLEIKIETMTADPHEGSPLSITRYIYNQQTVYYMESACCDKYNIVYDSVCNILGYPDGGYTGKGDGKMIDFKKEASDGKVVWRKGKKE